MEAVLQLPPGLPPHDAASYEPVPARTVATWPVGTFLENLAVLPGGDIAVSVLSDARVDRVTPDGTTTILMRFEQPPTGLAVLDGWLYAAVGEPGAGDAHLWRVDPLTGVGTAWMSLADIVFANGLTPFSRRSLLVADSWQGRVATLDLEHRSVVTWAKDDRLTRAPGIDFLPGANGVKRFGRSVVVSSNGRALLLRVPVKADGTSGPTEVIAERTRVDDFAFDKTGAMYLTTHIGHSLDRLGLDGRRVSLGGVDEGLAGSTACAFHPDGGLYVTTTGGIVAPPGGVLQPARLVRLEVGVTGAPLGDTA